jgi:DNA replication and repair protein RecF
MFIKEISLKDFRNFSSLSLKLDNGINIFVGENGQGKTNLLESAYFCASGRSPRTQNDRELIRFGSTEAHIQAHIDKNGVNDRIDVHIKNDASKGVAVNGLAVRKLGDLLQNVFAVIFSPEDLFVVKGGPAERRRFMDIQLCRLSAVYYYDLQQYYRSLKQRNLLLKDIQKKKELRETLFVWDGQLADFGARLIRARAAFVSRLSAAAAELHGSVSGERETLRLNYKPSATAEELLEKLSKNAERDIFNGTTQYGAHKDDIIFEINGKDARVYASQGQQRTACLAAVLAEAELIREEKNEEPILLLDDVFSELDEKRQKYLLKQIARTQTLITCTGLGDGLKKLCFPGTRLYTVGNGRIT